MKATITLLNKLKRLDSVTGMDVWYKYILNNIDYKKGMVQNISGTTVSMGQTFTVLIPFSDNFLPYDAWKSSEERDTHYTMSVGDIVLVGISLEEDVTPNSIPTIKQKYSSYVCEVRSVEEAESKYGVRYQLKVSGV